MLHFCYFLISLSFDSLIFYYFDIAFSQVELRFCKFQEDFGSFLILGSKKVLKCKYLYVDLTILVLKPHRHGNSQYRIGSLCICFSITSQGSSDSPRFLGVSYGIIDHVIYLLWLDEGKPIGVAFPLGSLLNLDFPA